jgi:ribonuclease P protein component
VYEHGTRYSGPYFAAFYARQVDSGRHGAEVPVRVGGPRIGFTLPRAIGGSVVRNRIKRRVREAVRQRLDQLSPEWEIVFNPRRAAMDSPFGSLTSEIEKLFRRCNNS